MLRYSFKNSGSVDYRPAMGGGRSLRPARDILHSTIMVDRTSYMFITDPCHQAVLNQDVSFEDAWRRQTSQYESGSRHFFAQNEKEGLQAKSGNY